MPTVKTTNAKQIGDILAALAYRIERGAGFQIILMADPLTTPGTVTHLLDWSETSAEPIKETAHEA